MPYVFVYGTLQTAQKRANRWPRTPIRVVPACVKGALYDLGPYPALLPGNDWVIGEAWEIAERDLPATLEVLDRIEGFASRPDDLYSRRQIECWLDSAESRRTPVSAWTYFYARQVRTDQRLQPSADGSCRWPTEPAKGERQI